MNEQVARAKFRSMDEGTAEDWAVIGSHFFPYAKELPDRVLTHLKLLDGDYGGFPIDRLQHSLQTATRAHRGGESEDYVVMALLHDIGDTLGTLNHPDIAAAIIKPFADEKLHWMCEHHGIFQGYYFFHYLGMDRDMREQSAAIRISRTPPVSASATTRPRSTSPTTPRLSTSSSRWSGAFSRHRKGRSTLAPPNKDPS